MGKKRLAMVGAETKGKKGKKEKRPLAKTGKEAGRLTDMGSVMLEELEKQEEKAETAQKTKKGKKETKKSKKAKKKRPKKTHSKRYQALKKSVDRSQPYPLSEAIKLLLKISNSKIDETVELHFLTEEKLSGTLNLPHGTGKSQKIEIASEKTLSQLKKGQINFDVLISSPQMMPKLAKYAKLLGPKGLMPNPKNNTIADKPEELVKKMAKGAVHYKTEAKAPLLHLIIGKLSFGEKKLLENLKESFKEIKLKNIKKAVLTSTHSPGIKLLVKEK